MFGSDAVNCRNQSEENAAYLSRAYGGTPFKIRRHIILGT